MASLDIGNAWTKCNAINKHFSNHIETIIVIIDARQDGATVTLPSLPLFKNSSERG